jgi:hypothetical protein
VTGQQWGNLTAGGVEIGRWVGGFFTLPRADGEGAAPGGEILTAGEGRNREVGGGIFQCYSTAPKADGEGDRPAGVL